MKYMVQDAGMLEVSFLHEEGLCWYASLAGTPLDTVPSDTMAEERSILTVTEDGVPLPHPHSPHTEIRSCGNGRFSHWGDSVRFSTPDNSNPLVNGRRYELAAGDLRMQLIPPRLDTHEAEVLDRALADLRAAANESHLWIRHAAGFCWSIDLDRLAAHHRHSLRSGATTPAVTEDGRPCMGPCAIDEVAAQGGGRWGVAPDSRTLYFSASDNSNPRLNGRTYVVSVDGAALPLPQGFAARILAGSGSAAPAADLVEFVRRTHRQSADFQRSMTADANVREYYPFLASLTRAIEARRILEIGTEFGGSAAALATGAEGTLERLVTVDVVDRGTVLEGRPNIVRVVADAVAEQTVRKVLDLFGHQPIDLLYVDSAHEYSQTLAHFAMYAVLLNPKLVVLDDILLNETMTRLWADIRRTFGARAINVCDVDPSIRNPDCGFGVILWRAG